jgi:hypothetical protein
MLGEPLATDESDIYLTATRLRPRQLLHQERERTGSKE